MFKRFRTICTVLEASIDNSSQRDPVRDAIQSFVSLHEAIEGIRTSYGAHLTADIWASLAATLVAVLRYVVDRDRDLYETAQVPRPNYASESSSGNLYRRWLLAGQPQTFLAILSRVPLHVLAVQGAQIEYCYNRMSSSASAHNGEGQRVLRTVFMISNSK